MDCGKRVNFDGKHLECDYIRECCVRSRGRKDGERRYCHLARVESLYRKVEFEPRARIIYCRCAVRGHYIDTVVFKIFNARRKHGEVNQLCLRRRRHVDRDAQMVERTHHNGGAVNVGGYFHRRRSPDRSRSEETDCRQGMFTYI